MNTIQQFLMLALLGCSAQAMQDDMNGKTGDPYDCIEFEFDMDFFRQKEIGTALNIIADAGWRILGCESNAYVKVKKIFNENNQSLELIIALLAAEKYPKDSDAWSSFEKLMKEIKLGQLIPRSESFTIIFSENYDEVYDAVRLLSGHERREIGEKLLLQLSAVMKNKMAQMTKSELDMINNCLKSMLLQYCK